MYNLDFSFHQTEGRQVVDAKNLKHVKWMNVSDLQTQTQSVESPSDQRSLCPFRTSACGNSLRAFHWPAALSMGALRWDAIVRRIFQLMELQQAMKQLSTKCSLHHTLIKINFGDYPNLETLLKMSVVFLQMQWIHRQLLKHCLQKYGGLLLFWYMDCLIPLTACNALIYIWQSELHIGQEK